MGVVGHGTGSKWETLALPAVCTKAALLEALERFPANALIYFRDPNAVQAPLCFAVKVYEGGKS